MRRSGLGGVVGVGGQEHHAGRVAAGLGQVEAGRTPAKKPVRDLDEDPGPVAGGHLGAGGAPVGQVLERGDRLADQSVAPSALEVGHQGDTAGVVLERGVVQRPGCVAGLDAGVLSSLGSLRGRSRGDGRDGVCCRPGRHWPCCSPHRIHWCDRARTHTAPATVQVMTMGGAGRPEIPVGGFDVVVVGGGVIGLTSAWRMAAARA